jgi:hypothetical protein
MFEEEAEEYRKDLKSKFFLSEPQLDFACQGFKDGAEFVYNEQLTKAKEIIKDYLTIAKGSHITLCGVPEENRTIHVLKLNEKAEEFLNSELIEKAEQFIKE